MIARGRGEGFEEAKFEEWCLSHVKITLIRPIVSIASAGDVAEDTPEYPGGFIVSRSGPTTRPLSVRLRYSGTASFQDHNNVSTRISIPTGESDKYVPIIPVDDDLIEGTETRIIEVLPSDDYLLGANITNVEIYDDDGFPPIEPEPIPPYKGGTPPPIDDDYPEWPEPDPEPPPGPDPAPTPPPAPGPTPPPPPTPTPPPPPPGDPSVHNFVNLVIGGWDGFWGWWGWPYGYASTIETYGNTQSGPGVPPTDESVFIRVNDDFDEGNKDIREIKPNNPRGVRDGIRQLRRYLAEMEAATGYPHRAELTLYD